MAMRDLRPLQKEVEKLTQDQQLELAQFLIENARSKKLSVKPVDIGKFYGTVDFPEDGLEYQHRVRAEWDR